MSCQYDGDKRRGGQWGACNTGIIYYLLSSCHSLELDLWAGPFATFIHVYQVWLHAHILQSSTLSRIWVKVRISMQVG